MTRYDRRTQFLAICLSAAAGFVDAAAFRQFGGIFVSFMSGNTTRLGVGLAHQADWTAMSAGLVAAFVGGAALGSLIGRRSGKRRRPVVLVLVAILLSAAAIWDARWPSALLMALAMGAENAVFEEDGDFRLGVTYMTGALAKLGQRLALVLSGGARFAWAPYLFLWGGLLAGAAAGAATSAALGLTCLWGPIVLILAVALAFVGRDHAERVGD